MSQTASNVSADPCGVCPAWVDGSPAAKTSKNLRRGCPAESPAPPAEPNSAYWTSVWCADKTHIQIHPDFFLSCFNTTSGSKVLEQQSFGQSCAGPSYASADSGLSVRNPHLE